MSKKRGTGVYNKSDILVTTKLNPDLHKYLSGDARLQFRTLPAHVAAILTNYSEIRKSSDTEDSTQEEVKERDPLYTEQELEDIYKQHNERKGNGRK
jgi:hypothetical protein